MLIRLLGLLSIFFVACSPNKEKTDSNQVRQEPSLGEIQIDVTCNEAALPVFKEGLLLLHSFQFTDAGEKFLEAQQLDKECAMAYWGEAMSKNHPLWREQEKAEALEIINRLGDNHEEQRSKFKTEFEKSMYDAISILYAEGTKKDNDKAYMQFMEELHSKFPDNNEVSAFYALSLLGASENGRDSELYGKGARIAQSIIDENPNHPGALHYLIHSYDDPENASKALTAANRYAKVAPDAAHALHMPSHIYVAMGMWDEVILSNKAAVAASIERQQRKKLEIKTIDFHSLKWLMYGHLQKGEFDKARTLVLQMQDYCEQQQSPKAVSHNVMMKSAYLTETNMWGDSIMYDEVDYSDLPIQIYASRCFMLGMDAFHKKDVSSINQLIAEMDTELVQAQKEALKASSTMCSGSYDRKRPTENHVKRAEVMQLQLKALVAMLENEVPLVDKLLRKAVEQEESTTYAYGPPDIVKPSHEMYAEWLEKNEKRSQAMAQYKKVLNRAPGRYIAVNAIEKLKNT